MNKILYNIRTMILGAIKEELPGVSADDLEGGGKVFYMNGKNGTEYDWFVNEHLPSFMVFYNDEENLDAAKALVYTDGNMSIYLFDNKGKDLKKEVRTILDADGDELLRLAVCLRLAADEKRVWDTAIDELESEYEPDTEAVSEFVKLREYCEPSIRRKALMSQLCVVSKKVSRDGWKVGFMLREEPGDDEDSGWQFFAGDEDDEFTKNIENLELCPVYSITGIDPALISYIESPAGTRLVRISPEEFEEDRDQPAYMEKWKTE